MTQVEITQLTIYPVKSLAGVSLQESIATPSGLEHDRQWAIFKADGHPLTQRQNPKMCLIQPRITEKSLYLSAVGFGEIEVPEPSAENTAQEFHVWKDAVAALPCENTANKWLAEVLGETQPLTLAKVNAKAKRKFHNPTRFDIEGQYFSDAAPYLIANQSSLDEVNQRIQQQEQPLIDMRHFRANIVIRGVPAFAEHQYSELSCHDVGFRLIDHCQRCIMITVNPDTGEYLPKAHPFKTVASANGMPNKPKAPAFGVNACLDHRLNANERQNVAHTVKIGQQFTIR